MVGIIIKIVNNITDGIRQININNKGLRFFNLPHLLRVLVAVFNINNVCADFLCLAGLHGV